MSRFDRTPLDAEMTKSFIRCPRCGYRFIRGWDEDVVCPECFLEESDPDPKMRKSRIAEPTGASMDGVPVYRMRTVYVLAEGERFG